MSHPHNHSATAPALTNLGIAFLLNLSFTLVEIAGGLWTNSLAILADALHDSGDTIALGLSWYMEKVALKQRDPSFSYGYKRFSLLAALVNGMVLLTGSCLILFTAVPRLLQPEAVHAQGMLWLALLGIAVNGLAVLRLRRGQTLNEKMVTWHLWEDVLGWVAVLLVSLTLLVWSVPLLDPLLAVGLTLFILWNVLKNLRVTLKIFLQSIPEEVDIPGIERKIRTLTSVRDIHDTHVWSLDGAYHILTTHVVIPQQTPTEEVIQLKQHIKALMAQAEIQHVTLEIEREDEACTLKEC